MGLLAGRVVVVMGVVERQGRAPALALEDEHMTAIRLGEQPLVEHHLGGPRGHDTAVDERRVRESLRGAQQVVTPIFGGSRHGIDPDADYRRDRAMIEAYNQRLGEKRCKVFDLVKELQPKPAGESPTLVKR